MRTICNLLRKSDEGTSLVEFALIAPFLVLLLLGLVDFGRYAAFSIRVGNAARAGAAYASQGEAAAYDDTGITNAACTDSGFKCPSKMTVSESQYCTYSDGTTNNGCPLVTGVTRTIFVQVTASATFTSLFNHPLLPTGLTVSNTATMQVAQ